jgi:hypothetical protein
MGLVSSDWPSRGRYESDSYGIRHSIGTPVLKSLWLFRIAYLRSFSETTACDLAQGLQFHSRCCAEILRSRRSWLPPFRSDLRSAAVNEQFNTRDETGVIRSQKQRHLCNFLGLPHASHRDGGHNPRNHVRRLPTRQWRIDRTRTNDVGADTTVLQICSPASRQRADCRLTRGVDWVSTEKRASR